MDWIRISRVAVSRQREVDSTRGRSRAEKSGGVPGFWLALSVPTLTLANTARPRILEEAGPKLERRLMSKLAS